jgi:hypothetical protein
MPRPGQATTVQRKQPCDFDAWLRDVNYWSLRAGRSAEGLPAEKMRHLYDKGVTAKAAVALLILA